MARARNGSHEDEAKVAELAVSLLENGTDNVWELSR